MTTEQRDTVRRVRLTGPAATGGTLTLAESIRPFKAAHSGLTFLEGETRRYLPYAELAEHVRQAAAGLRRLGVRPGARVATILSNELPSVTALLGIWAAGAAVVSLPPPYRGNRAWYASKFGSMLERLGCDYLVATNDSFADGALPRCCTRLDARLIGRQGGATRPPDEDVPATALIQFTSGSIGTPKGVAVGADILAGHVAAVGQAMEIDQERDKFVSWLPLYHDMGLIAMFLNALALRVDQVLMPPGTFASGPARWLTTLGRERGTVTAAPNFAYRMAAQVPYDPGLDLSGVRASLNGGERIVWQDLVGFHRTAGPLGFSWGALMPSYGLAEGVVGVTTTQPGSGPVCGPDGHVSVGRPLPGVTVDAPVGRPAGPVGIGGRWLFEGYHTRDAFVAGPRDGWFDTGDAGFAENGRLFVTGRRDEVASVAGHNVFAEDIEEITYQVAGTRIRACAAFRLGEPEQKFGLMIEIAPRPKPTETEVTALADEVRAAVVEALGIRLATLLAVRIGTISRTSSGKVQRAVCRETHASDAIAHRVIARI